MPDRYWRRDGLRPSQQGYSARTIVSRIQRRRIRWYIEIRESSGNAVSVSKSNI